MNCWKRPILLLFHRPQISERRDGAKNHVGEACTLLPLQVGLFRSSRCARSSGCLTLHSVRCTVVPRRRVHVYTCTQRRMLGATCTHIRGERDSWQPRGRSARAASFHLPTFSLLLRNNPACLHLLFFSPPIRGIFPHILSFSVHSYMHLAFGLAPSLSSRRAYSRDISDYDSEWH